MVDHSVAGPAAAKTRQEYRSSRPPLGGLRSSRRNWLRQRNGPLSAEPRRQEIEFSRVASACGRFDVLDGRKIALQLCEQGCLGAALQHLTEECAARDKDVRRELGCRSASAMIRK